MKTTTEPDHTARFRLLRYLAIASFLAVVLTGVGFGIFFRETALERIMGVGEDNNVALARTLAGALRSDYAPLLSGKAADAERLSAELRQTVKETIRDTRIVKLSLYDAAGRPLFTSDAPAAPDDAAAPGFIAALAGTVTTQIDHASAFDATGLVIAEPVVMTTHVPIRAAGSAAVRGVLAVSTDVTPFFGAIRRMQTGLRFGSAAVLALLFFGLLFVARRADKVIRTQDDQRQRDADTIRHLAQHDELTGLPGRKLFADRLALALARARRNKTAAAVMFIDLDNFKEVNDTFGHAVGDKVLVGAGRLLRAALRTSDTVARLGGDEFTIIVENVGDAGSVEAVAEKIRSAFMPPVVVAGGEGVFVTPSIGIALYPLDATEPEALLNAADAAMYDAKAAGRDAYSFFGASPVREPEPVTS